MTINYLRCISLYMRIYLKFILFEPQIEKIERNYLMAIPPTVYHYLTNNDVEIEEVLTILAFEEIEI